MKTLDAAALAKIVSTESSPEKQWLAEHDGEYDDLIYLEEQGRVEAKIIGCMLGHYREGAL